MKTFVLDTTFSGKYYPKSIFEYNLVMVDTLWLKKNCPLYNGCPYLEIEEIKISENTAFIYFKLWNYRCIYEINYVNRRRDSSVKLKIEKKDNVWISTPSGH